MGSGAVARLEQPGRPAEQGVETLQQAGRGAAEQRRERGAGDEIPRLADREILAAVVPSLTVQGLLHEGREGERESGAVLPAGIHCASPPHCSFEFLEIIEMLLKTCFFSDLFRLGCLE